MDQSQSRISTVNTTVWLEVSQSAKSVNKFVFISQITILMGLVCD